MAVLPGQKFTGYVICPPPPPSPTNSKYAWLGIWQGCEYAKVTQGDGYA